MLDINPYKSKRELLLCAEGKQKKTKISSVYCWFGIIFEECAVLAFEKKYNTKIYCKNISIIDGYIKNTVFSPDGLCAMPVIIENGQLETIMDTDNILPDECQDYAPTLIEIKCPLGRIPSGAVPACYKPQLQSGLMTINICHAAVFIDNAFRICNYDAFEEPESYNVSIHKKDDPIDHTMPLYIGAILVMGTLPKYVNRSRLSKLHIRGHELYDFGTAGMTTFTNILKAICEEDMELHYCDPSENTDDFNVIGDIARLKPVGIIPWKLYYSTYTVVYQDPEMIGNIIDVMAAYSDGTLTSDDCEVVEKKSNTMWQGTTITTSDLSLDC
jgi:hypothetical protein